MNKTLKRRNDNHYGTVSNGLSYTVNITINGGYDVDVKRASTKEALVKLTQVGSGDQFLATIEIHANTDLQSLAAQIALAPFYHLGELDADDWDVLIERWNAIELE
jgi:hypothetical protein